MSTVIRVTLPVEHKMFCGCKAASKETCPVCKKEAGAFRILNKEVVEAAIALTLSVGCELNQYTLFDRVKMGDGGYDLISQYSYPIGKAGKLTAADDMEVEMEAVRLYEGKAGEACAAIIIEESTLSGEAEEKLKTVLEALSIREWCICEEEQEKPVSYLLDASLPPVIISQWWTNQIAAKYPDLIHIEEPEMEEDDIF